MSAKVPGPCGLGVEEPRGSEACVNVADGTLVTCDLEVELADMVLETSDPTGLLCEAVAGLSLALANEFRECLDKVSNLCRARIRKRGADHPDDSGGEGARVVVSSGRAVWWELLRGGNDSGRLGCPLRGVDNFLSGGIEIGILGTVSGRGVGTTRDRVVSGRDVGGVAFRG